MDFAQRFLIIHGHFYQPPREDPRTKEIECQPSAYPYHDWNEKILHQCYAANAASRVLNERGEIERIINNYRFLSFNFGPTLLSWLKKKSPFSYQRIIEADRESRERNGGHGNAIAQVYHHQILPLSSDQDKVTQVEWALSSFKKDFGRDSEGIWLSEAAINLKVAEILVDYGIRFVILSPNQAEAVEDEESGEWRDVSDGSIDCSQPYLLQTSRGSLAVFFYDAVLAQKISFQHLLRNADDFKNEILSRFHPEKSFDLINIATDGETYGHHEAFGDMCLSRLIYENERHPQFRITNYAYFLEKFPPSRKVRLKSGNEGLGTAWSCIHGVDRWRKNCGCHTGGGEGWNQEWREPLRLAFDFLRDRLYASAENVLKPFIGDVWRVRNAFVELLSDSESNPEEKRKGFVERFAVKKLEEEEQAFVIRILEALHFEMKMYTSCAWFFSEISGIETVQVMQYASRVLELADSILPADTRAVFEEILSRAKSNFSEFQNGAWIFNRFVEARRFIPERVIHEYFLSHLLTEKEIVTGKNPYYSFLLNIHSVEMIGKADWTVCKSLLIYEDPELLEKNHYLIYVFIGKNEIRSYVKKYIDESLVLYLDKIIEKEEPDRILKDFKDWFLTSYTLFDLKYDVKQKILPEMFRNVFQKLHRFSEDDFYKEELFKMILLYRDLDVVIPEKDRIIILDVIHHYISIEVEKLKKSRIRDFDFGELSELIRVCRKANLRINTEELEDLVYKMIDIHLDGAIQLNRRDFSDVESLIDFSNEADLRFDRYEFQNRIYFRLEELLEDYHKKKLFKNFTKESLKKFLVLGKKFNLSGSFAEELSNHLSEK